MERDDDSGFGERICPRPKKKKDPFTGWAELKGKGARLRLGRQVHGPCATASKELRRCETSDEEN